MRLLLVCRSNTCARCAVLFCAQIPASSISFANTFGVLFTVVVYDLVIVKLAIK